MAGDGLFHDPGQAEVGDLRPVAMEQDVLRLQVAMLNSHPFTPRDRVLVFIEIIDRVGDGAEVAEQLPARDSTQAPPDRLQEAVPERAVGELHADDQKVVDLPGLEDPHERRVADVPSDLQGTKLAGTQVGREVDQLQRHARAVGRLGFPDVGKTAASAPLDQAIPGDPLGGLQHPVVDSESHRQPRRRTPTAVFAREIASRRRGEKRSASSGNVEGSTWVPARIPAPLSCIHPEHLIIAAPDPPTQDFSGGGWELGFNTRIEDRGFGTRIGG